MKRPVSALAGCLTAAALVTAQPHSIDRFFDDFTAEWIRGNPDQAVATRYLSGAEQQQLEWQLTPQTDVYARERRALARRGVGELDALTSGATLSPTQRISAELMRWQLQTYAGVEPYSDFNAERRASELFDHRPKAPVIARPFPRFRETNAAANYGAPAVDGSRPGIFQIPLRPERMTKFGLRSLINAVLAIGTVPLPVLDREVHAYIASKR